MIHGLDLRVLRSFVSVVETGSITETARRLGRTQPAITLQIQRLEETVGRQLLLHRNRQIWPTEHGQLVLSYARSMLRQHDELCARLSSPDIEGHVVLGTPDLYAASILPSILRVFRTEFPGIQVELHCSLSTPLVKRVRKAEVDIALVTRMNDFTGGIVVRQEELVWLVGDHASDILDQNPLPLALLPPGNIYRDHAIEAMERAGRKWRVACVTESMAGLQAAVFAGMAVTVLCKCAMVPGMRQVGHVDYFPRLPMIDLLLYRAPGSLSPAANALHDYLVRYLANETLDAQQSDQGEPPADATPPKKLVMAP
ncbi:MAG: LysR substrate-binding domain-containing protein [Alphaproteobacteria bacterium]